MLQAMKDDSIDIWQQQSDIAKSVLARIADHRFIVVGYVYKMPYRAYHEGMLCHVVLTADTLEDLKHGAIPSVLRVCEGLDPDSQIEDLFISKDDLDMTDDEIAQIRDLARLIATPIVTVD